jgi:galactokinase/mevalonate kinase-like predicted kinase
MWDSITRYTGSNANELISVDDVVSEYASSCEKYLKQSIEDIRSKNTNLSDVIRRIIDDNIPVSHDQLLNEYLKDSQNVNHEYDDIEQDLLNYALEKEMEGVNGNNALIKAERAYYILSDIVARKKMNDDPNYRSKIDELENHDFLTCMDRVLSAEKTNNPQLKWSLGSNEVLKATAPMKLALSSANNSDRHGAAKLEGSRVLNMAVNLVLSSDKGAEPTIHARIKLIDDQKLVFEGYNDMTGHFETHRFEMDRNSVEKFFNGEITHSSKQAFANSDDPFRFYKYALVFCGILRCFDRNDVDIRNELWENLMLFTDNKGLFINLENIGPSRSGFSSSSAVMTTILSLLYRASGQHEKLERVYDLALLAENCLGLRSGWNDTYCLMPGIHDFYTEPTNALPKPEVNKIEFDTNQLEKRLYLIHTGLQRKATGRMNRRHEIYLSKDPITYPYLLRSLAIHEHMVHCLHTNQYERLGELMTQYMDYRVAFDPEATNNYLEMFFKTLLDKGLIYGGLLAGAMGGGIAQVIASDKGLEIENGASKLENEIHHLRDFEHDVNKPFANALYRRIEFGVNRQGVCLQIK